MRCWGVQHRSSKRWVADGGHRDEWTGCMYSVSQIQQKTGASICLLGCQAGSGAPVPSSSGLPLPHLCREGAEHSPCPYSFPYLRELEPPWPVLSFSDVIQNLPISTFVTFVSPLQTCTYAYKPGHPIGRSTRGILAFPLMKTQPLHYGSWKI